MIRGIVAASLGVFLYVFFYIPCILFLFLGLLIVFMAKGLEMCVELGEELLKKDDNILDK